MLVFKVEEGSRIKVDKTNSHEAVYNGNFNEYIISKSHSLANTLIVADMFSDRDGVDVIDTSIKCLVFKDVTKNFIDIMENFNDKPANIHKDSFNLKKDFEFSGEIKSIKIVINGFDENSESVSLNLDILGKDSLYKYKIASDAMEISIVGDLDTDIAREILKSFSYKKIFSKSSDLKEIYVIINEKLIYKTMVEF